MISTIVTFIFVFGIIVLVHEFGHFIFAKRGGILVREFAIGMGPKLFHHRKNETTYTIRMLPIGGYVRMAGEGEEEVELAPGMPVSLVLDENGVVVKINPNKKVQLPNSIPVEVIKHDLVDDLYITGFENGDDSLEKRFTVAHDATIIEEDGLETQIAPRDVQFQSASLGRRMMTNFAGPMNNFILSFILFTIVAFMLGGVYQNSNTLGKIVEGSVAEKAGLVEGDKIVEINGKKTSTFEEVSAGIMPNANKEITLLVKDTIGKEKEVTVTPEPAKDNPEQGVLGFGREFKELTILEKFKYGITETFANSLMIFKALGNLVTDFSLNKLGGPVMIFKASEAVSNSGFIAILSFTAMLSVNLGIMNLVPIPGLDGGKLALNIFEGVRGKPLSQEKEVMITMIGVGILLLLMIAVTWNDIQRFFIR